ncbi:MAG TPA: hypothetical protein ENG95_02810 [Nitrospirae bacterium]|nr:hypothetical protein BMS3Abin10_00641 [bacterium BMS3Abin10]GBE39370.1 hypothetical protein BMS3Bbin08_01992 [bacterium BMS3Bbin08]HDK17398.1 hypothetical protein [Nitrospirota bacterium]HDK81344.1 hypothetical protein [Nitrospirota bacterium]HDO25563.1 hypothetical protein [Nitrospirota bacterium]
MLNFKGISAILCLFAIFSCGGSEEGTGSGVTGTGKSLAYEKLNIIGETLQNGIFDPSIEYADDGNTG